MAAGTVAGEARGRSARMLPGPVPRGAGSASSASCGVLMSADPVHLALLALGGRLLECEEARRW